MSPRFVAAGGSAVPCNNVVVRRVLLDGDVLQVGHVAVRPVSAAIGDVETQPTHVFVLPLTGVFARHDSPRRYAIVTPEHAAFIPAHRPYRLSFPGAVGDEALTLRLTDTAREQLSAAVPVSDGRSWASSTSMLLPAGALLARSLLWRRLASNASDRMEVEELGVGLLAATLRAAFHAGARTAAESTRRQRAIERVKEVVALDPERRWTLGRLADVAAVSPWHLAHSFRAEVGTSVYRYLVRARLARALDAVLDSDCALTAIALDAGFASHSHFTARFRAFFGLTPGALRRAATSRLGAELRKIVTAPEFAAA